MSVTSPPPSPLRPLAAPAKISLAETVRGGAGFESRGGHCQTRSARMLGTMTFAWRPGSRSPSPALMGKAHFSVSQSHPAKTWQTPHLTSDAARPEKRVRLAAVSGRFMPGLRAHPFRGLLPSHRARRPGAFSSIILKGSHELD